MPRSPCNHPDPRAEPANLNAFITPTVSAAARPPREADPADPGQPGGKDSLLQD